MSWQQALVYTYTFGLVVITVYSVFQLHLLYYYFRWERAKDRYRVAPLDGSSGDFPPVTVQLPIFNELYVAERVIDAVAAFDWPADRLEIQVLDDSTDETRGLVERRVAHWRGRGVDVKHIHRTDRRGFKAGALADATPAARGRYIAIFDADFVPDPDFLRRIVAYFDRDDIAVVQARWGHLNPGFSLLTRIQGILLDGFYLIEQPARAFADFYLRFNGSGGMWRKAAIADAGGWSGETLTEDLDLSYRAQLKGWKIRYAQEVVAEAELPVRMADFKRQQFRWTKGKAQVIRKLSVPLLRTRMGFERRVHAFADLFNVFAYVAAFVCSVLSVPMAWILFGHHRYPGYLIDTSFALLSLVVMPYYVLEILGHYFQSPGTRWRKLGRWFFPVLFTVIGITFYQTLALIQGLTSRGGTFLRTPKLNLGSPTARREAHRYRLPILDPILIVEGLLAAYFLLALGMDFALGAYAFLPFHLLLGASYFFVVATSVSTRKL